MKTFHQWSEEVIEDAPKGEYHKEISHYYENDKLIRVYAVLTDGRLTGAYKTWHHSEHSTSPSHQTIFGKGSPKPGF